MNVKDLSPETDLVQCVFSWRSSNMEHVSPSKWDSYDHALNVSSLKRYTYRVPEYLKGTIRVGDTVLVHCQTGYQVCEVVATNVLSGFDTKSFAPVVSVVNMEAYITEMEKAEKLKVMRATIEKEKKRLEAMVTYDLIAEKNPEFAEMLKVFKEAGGEL